MKNKLLVALVIIVGLILFSAGYLWFSNIYRLNNKIVNGTIIKLNNESWGIETNFPSHKISVKDLPAQFQKENIKVSCRITILDIIGSDDWNVYAEVSECITK